MSMMNSVASEHLGRLWLTWAGMLAIDMRSSVDVALEHRTLMLRHPELDMTGVIEEHDRALARIASVVEMTRECSGGARAVVGELVASLAFRYSRLVVRREGDLRIRTPTEHLGFVLWIAVHSHVYSHELTRLEVVVTDSALQIAIGQLDVEDSQDWHEGGPDLEGWWFDDAVAYLRASGWLVDARKRGRDWLITLIWSRR